MSAGNAEFNIFDLTIHRTSSEIPLLEITVVATLFCFSAVIDIVAETLPYGPAAYQILNAFNVSITSILLSFSSSENAHHCRNDRTRRTITRYTFCYFIFALFPVCLERYSARFWAPDPWYAGHHLTLFPCWSSDRHSHYDADRHENQR